uniref:Uncharacterized protein n=1 Tax=Fagus sylvatica TaxID=28930 RepID=A0A2N9GMX4_FAGSY
MTTTNLHRGEKTGRTTKKLTAVKSPVAGEAKWRELHPGAGTGQKAQEVPLPPSQHKTAKTNRSSKQPERTDRITRNEEANGRYEEQPEKRKLPVTWTTSYTGLILHSIPNIADFLLPSRFKVPLLENFDGTKDPFDYLEAFKTIMQLQAVPEEVMCRAFPLGLRGSARVWFNKLESESIGSFVQLSRAFIDHFIGSQRRGRPPTSPAQCQANGGRVTEDIRPPETMSELMYEATKHMNAEDALEAMDDPPPKRRKDTEDRKPEPAKQKVPKFTETPERKRTTAPPVKFSSFTPLNTPIDKLLLQIQDDPSLRWPGLCSLERTSRDTHRQGKLQKYVSRPANTRPAKPPAQREQTEHNRPGPVGEIRTIIGGPASGGTSRASRKAYARQVHNIMVVQRPPKNVRLDDQIISFSEEDARGTHQPHDDALVITINIAGFTTRRVMVDNGSSADILYLPAYQQMRLDKDKLRPMDAPLVGFTSDKTVDFLVVNCPSAYNAIIGRPTLNRLRAVTSTYHLLLKFPTEHGIGEVRGDQVVARECYLASLGPEGQNQTMTIEEHKILVKPSEELDIIELEDGHPERTTKIGANLPPKMKESLVQFPEEQQRLKQKRRVFAPERNNAIMEEMDKLLAANFIREVFYPDWLANVVMVKKNTGKWRMCVDFTDLNKACPKDSFPLPRIDQLVDSTAGHKLLTFMDAFSGYNQIVMDESDQEKTSFITSRGLFCYKVMPFGLKNAGATYQRLMNRMFHDQIGRNVEVYVDDMLVKSKEEDGHLDDLRETFETLRKYQMKLNPSKCAFGVYSGKFLGFMVSQRGIEANPDKIKAILEMQPPKTTKEVQRLTGRVAALNQQAFEELKRYLTEPPLLSPSKPGEELYLYLAVSPTAVSSALIREEERRQLPVYYTSRALRGAEERYPSMEKLAFALPDDSSSGQLSLASSTLTYRPRTAIKAQALADFIAEFTSKDDEPTKDIEQTSRWTVNIDGSSTKGSGGIGIVLKSPEGLKMAKALGATELDVLSDSQLVVGQVNVDYEAKEGRMQRYLHLAQHQISQFREGGTLPDNRHEARRLKVRASRFLMLQGTLYKRGFSLPYLRCLAPDEDQLRYEGNTRRNLRQPLRCTSFTKEDRQSGLLLAVHAKLTPADSSNTCDKCQRFANLLHSPLEVLVPMMAPWPFAQWGLDIMGPFPTGRRQLKFLVVAIDYFTKWVEAEPLATITEKNIQNFVWKAIICRFGIPRVLVSDNGKQFDNPRFRQFSQELGIHNHYSSPGHPQANGQVEVTNRSLLKLIKTRLEGAKGLWPEELPSILWAYRTTVRIPTGETPFRMTFGSEAVVPVEIGLTTLRTSAYDDQQNEEQLRLNLDLIDEVRETAEARMKRYQEKMARHYNSKVKPKQLLIGDLVLRKVTLATRNPSEGKLGPNWEGPYKVIEVRRPGTYHLEDMNGRQLPHPWNAEHLRKYYP